MKNIIIPYFKKPYLFKKNIIITGHFGCGKTNVAVNIAFYLKKLGYSVSIADIDIVNPYFRTADNQKELNECGIRCVVPYFANTNLDVPSIPPELFSLFDSGSDYNIFDIGGDDSGAAVLGMLSKKITSFDYDMFYVVNKYRPLISESENAVEIMRSIEKKARFNCTAVINNSNIGDETDENIFLSSFKYEEEILKKSGLVSAFGSFCVRSDGSDKKIDFGEEKNIFYMNNITKKRY